MAVLLWIVRGNAFRSVPPGRIATVCFTGSGRTAAVRMASTLPSPLSPSDEIEHALAFAKVAGDDFAKRHLLLWIAAEKNTIAAEKEVEKLAAEKNTIAAEKNTIAAEKEVEKLAGEKNTIAAEKALVDNALGEMTLHLARYEAVLLPRIMIEMALRAKYPPKQGGTFNATGAWDKFLKECVLDASKQQLCPAAAVLSRKLGCTEHPKVIVGDLETLYNRISYPLHHRKFLTYRSGLYCGGDATTMGCANAIAVKMLQDDSDVQRSGALAFDIIYLDPNLKPTLIFAANNTIVNY
jgi:hypothetical protein